MWVSPPEYRPLASRDFYLGLPSFSQRVKQYLAERVILLFSLKAKHVNTGAGVAHMWLKWLRVLRGRWATYEPRGCGESSQAGEEAQLEPRWEGRARGRLLTGGELHTFIICKSPLWSLQPLTTAALRPALPPARVCICLRARFLRAGEIWVRPHRIQGPATSPRLGRAPGQGSLEKGVSALKRLRPPRALVSHLLPEDGVGLIATHRQGVPPAEARR